MQTGGRGSCCVEGTLDGSPRDGEWGPSSLGSRPRCASSIFGIEPPPSGRAIVKSCLILCLLLLWLLWLSGLASPCARPLSRSRADTHFTSNSNARPPAYLSHGAVLAVAADDVFLPYRLKSQSQPQYPISLPDPHPNVPSFSRRVFTSGIMNTRGRPRRVTAPNSNPLTRTHAPASVIKSRAPSWRKPARCLPG